MDINLTGSNDSVEATDALARVGDDSDQMKRGSLTMAFYGVVSAMFFVYIGAAMALAYGTINALIGIVLTIVAYGSINAVLSKYAINNRVTVAQFSRTILGTSGSAIATIIFALVAIYYAVFEGLIVAYAFTTAFGGEMWLWSLIVVIYSTPLVVGGARRFLDKLNGWLMPLYWGGFVTAIIWAGVQYGFNDRWLTQAPDIAVPFAMGGPGWLATLVGYMGIWIMMMFTMDFASLGKRKDTTFHRAVTFGPVFYILAFGINALFGIFLTFTIPGLEVSETGIAGGLVTMMGLSGLLVVVASQTRINTANYYLGAANLKAFGERVFRINMPNVLWVIAAAIIIYALLLLPVVEYLLLALAWQGVLVTGWLAIALTHVLVGRGQKQEHGAIGDRHYKPFNTAGIIAWVIATVAGILLLQFGGAWGATWGPIITVALAAGTYLGARRMIGVDTALIRAADVPPRPVTGVLTTP